MNGPSFFLNSLASHRNLPSFPTRRSSDLSGAGEVRRGFSPRTRGRPRSARPNRSGGSASVPASHQRRDRSEEHTSELQSHVNFVCRLLLEKKKQESG